MREKVGESYAWGEDICLGEDFLKKEILFKKRKKMQRETNLNR